MVRCFIEPRTRKYLKVYGFLSFTRSTSDKYRKQLIDIAAKTGPKNCNQKSSS